MPTLPVQGLSLDAQSHRRATTVVLALLVALAGVASLFMAQQAGAAEQRGGAGAAWSATGQTCVVGKGLVTRGTARRGTGGTAGRVVVKGPGGTWLVGSYRCRNRSNWTVTVDGGSGTVGGVVLSSSAFRGTISSSRGAVTSNVSVQVGAHPRLVPEWNQSAVLQVFYAASSMRGNVWLSTSVPGN